MARGEIYPPGDVDLYTFAGKDGDVAFAQITRGTLANGVYMEILDPAGKSIASDSTSNQTLILRPTLSITGLHRILVSAWGGTGTYAVALQKVGG